MTDQAWHGEKAAARILGVHPRTLRRWREKGLIRHYRHPISGRVSYRSEDLAKVQVRILVDAFGLPCPQTAACAALADDPVAGTLPA